MVIQVVMARAPSLLMMVQAENAPKDNANCAGSGLGGATSPASRL
jgi:hypothetical protein